MMPYIAIDKPIMIGAAIIQSMLVVLKLIILFFSFFLFFNYTVYGDG